jgi:hypothetical protein
MPVLNATYYAILRYLQLGLHLVISVEKMKAGVREAGVRRHTGVGADVQAQG